MWNTVLPLIASDDRWTSNCMLYAYIHVLNTVYTYRFIPVMTDWDRLRFHMTSTGPPKVLATSNIGKVSSTYMWKYCTVLHLLFLQLLSIAPGYSVTHSQFLMAYWLILILHIIHFLWLQCISCSVSVLLLANSEEQSCTYIGSTRCLLRYMVWIMHTYYVVTSASQKSHHY